MNDKDRIKELEEKLKKAEKEKREAEDQLRITRAKQIKRTVNNPYFLPPFERSRR